VSERALDALDRIVDGGEEADDVLRGVLEVLVAEPAIDWAGVAFREEGALVLGPEAGTPSAAERTKVAVVYEGSDVGELWVDGNADKTFLEQVAARISAYVLIGWDTQGEAWEP
jgi:hypothetical protein